MANVANVGSIADFAWNRIDGVPSAISGTAMVQYATTAIYNVENYVGLSIGTTAIDQSYVPLLVEFTVMMTLSRMHGIGVDYNWTLGEFSVQKGTGASDEELQINVAARNVELALRGLPQPNKVYATYFG